MDIDGNIKRIVVKKRNSAQLTLNACETVSETKSLKTELGNFLSVMSLKCMTLDASMLVEADAAFVQLYIAAHRRATELGKELSIVQLSAALATKFESAGINLPSCQGSVSP